jgi:hypothetical protein
LASHEEDPLQFAASSRTLQQANQRYLKFISEVATPEVGVEKLHRLAEPQVENDHRFKGFNLLSEEDTALFRTLLRGEFTISGFTAKDLRQLLSDRNPGQMTRLLRRLRAHGLIKVTDLPCLRDSQSSLQYLRSLVTDYCTRKWSQRNWTHPMPRVPHLTNARHHLLPSLYGETEYSYWERCHDENCP